MSRGTELSFFFNSEASYTRDYHKWDTLFYSFAFNSRFCCCCYYCLLVDLEHIPICHCDWFVKVLNSFRSGLFWTNVMTALAYIFQWMHVNLMSVESNRLLFIKCFHPLTVNSLITITYVDYFICWVHFTVYIGSFKFHIQIAMMTE